MLIAEQKTLCVWTQAEASQGSLRFIAGQNGFDSYCLRKTFIAAGICRAARCALNVPKRILRGSGTSLIVPLYSALLQYIE